MLDQNHGKRETLKKEWAFFRPWGPHESEKENIKEMNEADVEKMMEIADEMAEVL